MKGIAIAAAYCLCPFLVFYTMAAFEDNRWQNIYWIWDKGGYVLLWYVILTLSPKPFKYIAKLALLFTTIRFIWHLITVPTGLLINDPPAINILFTILVAALILTAFAKWRQRN